eukprot:6711543-Prymnesium_polylepis.2
MERAALASRAALAAGDERGGQTASAVSRSPDVATFLLPATQAGPGSPIFERSVLCMYRTLTFTLSHFEPRRPRLRKYEPYTTAWSPSRAV